MAQRKKIVAIMKIHNVEKLDNLEKIAKKWFGCSNKEHFGVRQFYEKGDYIIYWTARGSVSGIDLKEFTKNQLKEWGAKYHDLDVGKKPHFDMYICDKSYNSESFFQRTLNELP